LTIISIFNSSKDFIFKIIRSHDPVSGGISDLISLF